ncbi:fibronectin type III domain-containing protein 1 isoform X1 [Etheostoma spectabile]|uniref:fibronectin type III domain-containing protein 1 isoform X1 n=1 Tax=Etheostoma spectabile TaxID=54343 RepID=UPI0013AFAEE5|nr:fibronectin type III domain-containing protein 1 isoform X1 [Etheostoma spectabile]
MAGAASRTLLALFVTFCAPGCGWTAEKPLRPHNGKQTSVDKGLKESWEPSIHLDGRPVDRFIINSNKPTRSHRFTKVVKNSHSPLPEDVDPEWVNLDGFAVLGGAPVSNTSAGPARSPLTAARKQSPLQRATRVDRTAHPLGVSKTRTHRRAPQSSSGPRQPERASAGVPPLERRRQHHIKPQSDQRNRNTQKLTSESVHVVSLQAQKAQGQGAAASRAVATKTTTPVPPEYEARDISVRVMSPQSVLISWVDPAVEMGKVEPGVIRSYTVRYREKGESARWEYKDSTQRRIMIDSLCADGMYEFSVRISQGENQGKWSVSVFQRTPESAPSGPPENFEVKPLRGKGTAVIATWDPPEEPNGRIREYILSYAPAMKPFGMKSVTYRGTTATIDGLTPGERYIFKIRATNRRGQGPQSKVLSVIMPGSSRAASSFSKTKDNSRTSHTLSKQDADHDEPDLQSTEEPTMPPQPRPAAPVNGRVRPLSQSRSYHSIFSSVRGSVRNPVNRWSSRGEARNREDKEVEEEKETTTPSPVEETTTMEVVPEIKEPDNNVPPDFEDEVGYDEKPLTTETPSLKVLTHSPTKPRPNSPPRRPIKIRVHQKPGSKAASSSSSSSTSSSSYTSSSSSDSSSSSTSASRTSSTSRIQESAASRKDYVASTYPESKEIYDRPRLTHTKPPSTVVKETNLQQTEDTSVGRSSASAGRTNGSGLGSKYGYIRRRPGILFRGNSTRTLNGYKPAVTSQSNLPSRTLNPATSNTRSSATSQSTLPDRTPNHVTSHSFNSATSSQATLDAYDVDKLQSTSGSRSKGSSSLQSSGINPSTSQSSSNHPSKTDTAGSSQSISHRGSHGSATSHNTQSSHTSLERDTTFREGNDDTNYKSTDTQVTKVKEPTSSSIPQPTEERGREEKEDEEGKAMRSNEKSVVPRTGISASFAEKFPWLASRYPGKFGPVTRASSSRHDGRTSMRGTPTRVSGATGAAGVSIIQQTSKDLKTDNLLKNGVGAGSVKPSFTNQNTASSDTRNLVTSSSSSSSSSAATSSNSNSHHSSGGHRDSSEHVHRGTSNDKDDSQNEDYLSERSRDISGKYDKVADPTAAQNNPTPPLADPNRNVEDNDSVDTRESFSRTRPGSPSGGTQPYRRSGMGVNGKVRSPLLANRPFGGSRLPIRPQPAQNSRLDSSKSDPSSSSSDSSPSLNGPQPVLTSDRDIGSGTTVTKTGGLIGGNSQSTSLSTASSSRDTFRGQGRRSRYPIVRGKPTNGGQPKPANGNGKNGRPNLTATSDKETSSSHGTSKAVPQRFITGPDGTKWVVDLERGVLMNQDGQILQDSRGVPKRVVLGEDGRTIFDHMGSPLLNQDGMALFGHGRDSQPVVNPKEKVLMIGGKPVLGLDLPHLKSTTTTTTTMAPTTTPEPTTTEWIIEESTTALPYPTCPPGTFSKTDEYGYPVLDTEGILDCYPEEESSGMEMDHMVSATMVPDALALKKDELFGQTTLPPTTTSTSTTTTELPTPEPDTRPSNHGPSSEFDLSGKKRFTAPYVNYIRKDLASPCSLTEALEYLQVDVLEDLIEKDSVSANQKQPPKNKPHNFTVVAMEGCHSFIILDWGRPLKDDMVSGYMVHSASYDDVLNNRWSSRPSSGTHLPVENLKPNSRYYFKVQAKNVFGLGPVSDTLTYVTESDDPLLIERPPGGEPIWIPFTFKYNSAHSSCKGSQYVKRTWYRKFVGVVLCNSLRYKIFMGEGLREPFYSIGDTFGQGDDHCQFVDSYRDGRTGPAYLSNNLPSAQGFYRAYRQEPVSFGVIGRRTAHPFVGWYECGVPIPGKW